MSPLRSPEFPPGASEWPEHLSRRDFARLGAATAAMAGLTQCTRQPIETLVPYVEQPEQVIPGRPLYFASAMVIEGFARGILVESHEGRPTKIEGNPDHPASLGATDARTQAAVRELYDPERSRAVTRGGKPSTWSAFEMALRERVEGGGDLRLLTEKTTSPTLLAQMDRLRKRFPQLRWHHYDPLDETTVTGESSPAAALTEIGDDLEVIVSLDDDLFGEGPAALRLIRQWARRRKAGAEQPVELFVAESSMTITGARADHRLAVRSSEIGSLAERLVNAIGGAKDESAWVTRAAEAMRNGKGLIVAGRRQPRAVHERVREFAPASTLPEFSEVPPAGFTELVEAMRSGKVETLLVFGGDPVVSAPADLGFAEALEKVAFTAHLGLFENGTSRRCQWQLPEAHFLESWSDARAYDGSTTVVQPLIEPLYGGRSAHEILALVAGETERRGRLLIRDTWRDLSEPAWRSALSRGVMGEKVGPELPASEFSSAAPETAPSAPEFEINFRPDPCLHDGRFARNAWLQELPTPITTQVWGNAVLLSPATARRLGVKNEDVLELARGERTVRGPVLVQPGHAEDSATVHLGHGGEHGFDAYPLRDTDAFWFGEVEVRATGETAAIVTTQHHQSMEGRDLVRKVTREEFAENPEAIAEMGEAPAPGETLYPPVPQLDSTPQWGMAIDLNACVGCSACVLACQSENNTPVVGVEQVAMGREMHWIRVDTYFGPGEDVPAVDFQPVPCMHCENAPCELVCPVAATVHDSEGLNTQVYNRCIGTRYCSNNCPYKVRRFNFLEYNPDLKPVEQLQKNPDVTVRTRGVMEKCTYCVQRISAARIEAKKEDRAIRDGEVVPACAQACPAEAIVFGDISDPDSAVSRLKRSPLDYSLLGETNTRPRTTYLAKLTSDSAE